MYKLIEIHFLPRTAAIGSLLFVRETVNRNCQHIHKVITKYLKNSPTSEDKGAVLNT